LKIDTNDWTARLPPLLRSSQRQSQASEKNERHNDHDEPKPTATTARKGTGTKSIRKVGLSKPFVLFRAGQQ
jgi:hypothetical protein